MKKHIQKVLLPLTALLVSSCSFSDLFNRNKNGDADSAEKQDIEPEDSEKEIYWNPDNPTSIETQKTMPMTIGESKSLTVTYSPQSTKNKTVSWASKDTSVATVVGGKVTAIGEGKTIVFASTQDTRGETITAECSVVVTDSSKIHKTHLQYNYDDYCANNAYMVDNCPLVGRPKLLVVPIWFSDSNEFISYENREIVRDDIRKTFFGTNEETGWRSVKSFYEEESKGIMTLEGKVTNWYDLSESYNDYGPESTGYSRTWALVEGAATWYFENSSETRNDYDTNSDGYLDGVILVYGAPESSSIGKSGMGNLWAYTSWLQDYPSVSNPVANVFFWGSYDFMYSSGIDAYERTDMSMAGRGDTRHCNVDAHCYIHEMGHVLGLSDYYDYNGQSAPAAGFSMQDMNVGGHDPYSVMAYGWADPYIPTETTTININDFQSSHDMILLANHEVTTPFDEYLLLELFTPTGLNDFDTENPYLEWYPRGTRAVGVRLWHIDSRLTAYNYSTARWEKNLITDPTYGNVYHAVSNTSYLAGGNSATPLGREYADYSQVQLIKKENNGYYMNSASLFKEGSYFDVYEFSDQFVRNQRMNDGKYLGWSFTVDAMDDSSATITVTKE